MTIGVGYFSNPRIILGCDMEITGVAKYTGNKDNYKWFDNENGVIASVYSGKEDDIRNVWEHLAEKIQERNDNGDTLGVKGVRTILEESLDAAKSKDFRMLIGITKHGDTPSYLRVTYRTPAPAQNWEIIGGGDVELSRYLVDLMNHPMLTAEQAILWGLHIIKTASSYVQGVGHGIKMNVIEEGRVYGFGPDLFLTQLRTFEDYIAGLWSDFCNLSLSESEFKLSVDAFRIGTLALKEKLPRKISFFTEV